MLQVDPLVYPFAALLILTLPMDWLLSAMFAAAFHEFCHWFALKRLGGRIYSLKIAVGGAEMESQIQGEFRECLCALAGPAGSMLLFLLHRWLPKTAICALIQGGFNLLPIYPLDGGRVLGLFLERICPRQSARVGLWIECSVMLMISIVFFVLSCRYSMGAMPMLLIIMLIIKVFQRKRPCKQGENRVQ